MVNKNEKNNPMTKAITQIEGSLMIRKVENKIPKISIKTKMRRRFENFLPLKV